MTPASAPAARLDLTIATRESRLALWQAQHVQALLQAAGHRVRLLGLTTRGDQILDRTLSKVGGKGLFVKELEVALEEGRADLAVHSLKDVPMELPAGFALAAVLPREDPRDAWVSPHCDHPRQLPPQAVVGTSSLRRLVLLRALLRDCGRDDVRIEPLRGNLDTRLRKLDEGQYHAIVLAAAGLKRLGLQQRIRHLFDPQEMLPAAGQGALGLEVLQARADVAAVLAPLADWPTWCAVEAERAVSRALGGSCSVPLAAHASWAGVPPATPGTSALLTLHAAWGDAETTAPLCTTSVQEEVGTLQAARALGERAARELLRQGARGASV
ncbi:MAG: hydroxymethylbilane synthase [Tepidimonas sp.]|uniref:hydroxymethylbilane synthase n=1 Tax=Tepidimonas sp. TaxID=2002775 RepID=UPI00298F13F5|nr:hydroxymethylbilane synthase [Tepidimonas sp.]MDW8336604.1 hydroxymethylbilane synthase [Tepidimonas sp.]